MYVTDSMDSKFGQNSVLWMSHTDTKCTKPLQFKDVMSISCTVFKCYTKFIICS